MKKTKGKKTGFLFQHIKKEKLAIIGYILLVCVLQSLNFVLTLVAARLIVYINALSFDLIYKYLWITLGLLAGNYLINWLNNVIFVNLVSKISFNVKNALTVHSLKLTSSTYSSVKTGSLASRITRDPDDAVFTLDGILESFIDLIRYLAVIIYVSCLNVWIGLIMLVSVLVLISLEVLRTKIRQKDRKLEKTANDNFTSITNEMIRAERDVKSLNFDKSLAEGAEEKVKIQRNIFIKTRFHNFSLWLIRKFLTEVIIIGICFLSVFLIKDLTLSLTSFFFIYVNKDCLNAVIYNIGGMLTNYSEFKVNVSRISELYDPALYKLEKFGETTFENFRGEIEFKDVSFAYDTQITNDKMKVLNNISFKIEPNTTVGFVGKSGSGKSTILALIEKLYEAISGEILVDGVNINELTKDSVRNNINLVNQSPYIFNLTLRENLLLVSKNATDDDLVNACKKAALWDFICSLPSGLDTLIGENGITLSGGQRQRLAIARALLKESSVILFDESTSSLDNIAQEYIQKSIENLSGKHTVVIVAHRLSTILNCDKLFFVEEGRIIDQGTFGELIERNEKFKEMFLAEKNS